MMPTNTQDIYGARLISPDGDIGQVSDFYFDDWNWVVRYVVADTGPWLPGRLVLLPPQAFEKLQSDENTLHLKLSKQQIADSPPFEPHRPVSRQDESAYYRHFGWPAYWEGPALWGTDAVPVVVRPSRQREPSARPQHHHRDEKHLQSARAVVNCHIQTTDGTVGHVTGFLLDDKSWAIRQFVVETGAWHAGREILIDPDQIERISHQTFKVFARLTKADILRNEEQQLVHAGSNNPGAWTLPTE